MSDDYQLIEKIRNLIREEIGSARGQTRNFTPGTYAAADVTIDRAGNLLHVKAGTGGGGAASGVRAYVGSGGETVATGDGSNLTFTATAYDTGSYWSGGAPERLTAPATGDYLIIPYVSWGFPGDGSNMIVGDRRIVVTQKSSGGVTIETFDHALPALHTLDYTARFSIAWIVSMSTGDYLTMRVEQNSGNDLVVATGVLLTGLAIERCGTAGGGGGSSSAGLIARANMGVASGISAGFYGRLNFANVDTDPLSTITTGGSWIFTAPATGYYDVEVSNLILSGPWTQSDEFHLALWINGSFYGWMAYVTIQSTFTGGYIDLNRAMNVPLAAGDTLFITLQSTSADARTAYGGVISINRGA